MTKGRGIKKGRIKKQELLEGEERQIFRDELKISCEVRAPRYSPGLVVSALRSRMLLDANSFAIYYTLLSSFLKKATRPNKVTYSLTFPTSQIYLLGLIASFSKKLDSSLSCSFAFVEARRLVPEKAAGSNPVLRCLFSVLRTPSSLVWIRSWFEIAPLIHIIHCSCG